MRTHRGPGRGSIVSITLLVLSLYLVVLHNTAPVHGACGDGAIDGGDTCDDSNTDPNDGCSATCQTEPGWKCTGAPSTCVNAELEVIGIGTQIYTSCVLFVSGHVKCWGWNHIGSGGGSPGLGDEAGELAAVPFITLPSAASITSLEPVGNTNCAFYSSGGQMYCWGAESAVAGRDTNVGYNSHYSNPVTSSVLSTMPAGVTSMGNDIRQRCIINAGVIRCFGYCVYGNCGRNTATAVYLGDNAGEMASLTAISFGSTHLATKVCGGYYSQCALFNNGMARCWGYSGTNGWNLGSGHADNIGDDAGEMATVPFFSWNTTHIITDMSHGYRCTCFIFNNNGIRCFGYYGCPGQQMAAGDAPNPISELDFLTFQTTHLPIKIFTGSYGACALFSVVGGNKVRCWGYNPWNIYQSTHGTYIGSVASHISNVPWMDFGTTVGVEELSMSLFDYTHCARFAATAPAGSSRIRCWGLNRNGMVGQGHASVVTSPASLNWLAFGTTHPVVSIPPRIFGSMCALFDVAGVNKARCWGYGYGGQLGILGSHPSQYYGGSTNDMLNLQDIPLPFRVEQIYSSMYHTSVMNDGKYTQFGYSPYGTQYPSFHYAGQVWTKLATLSYMPFGDTVPIVQLAAGYYHTCARFGNRKVRCWGYNGHGECGMYGHIYPGTDGYTPAPTALPYLTFSNTNGVKDVSADHATTCVVFDDGRMVCFGYNAHGTAGADMTNNIGYDNGYYLETQPMITFGTADPALFATVGVHHACAVFDVAGSTRMRCWGYNAHYQCGVGHTSTIAAAPGANSISNVAYISFSDGFPTIKALALGYHNTGILFADGRTRTWGYPYSNPDDLNTYSGDATRPVNSIPYINWGVTDLVTELSLGYHHTCALFSNLRVKCAGHNNYGEIGMIAGGDYVVGNTAGETSSIPFISFTTDPLTNSLLASPGYTTPVTGVTPPAMWINDNQIITMQSSSFGFQKGDFYEFVLLAAACPATNVYDLAATGAQSTSVTQTFTTVGIYKVCYRRKSGAAPTAVVQPGVTFTVGPRVLVSGSMHYGSENDVRGSASTIVLTLDGDTWAAALTTGNALVQTLLNGFSSNLAGPRSFMTAMYPQLSTASLIRTSATVITINIPANDSYAIESHEEITIMIDGSLTSTTLPSQSREPIRIENDLPVATLSGTATTGFIPENDIRSGGRALTISLSGTYFKDSVQSGDGTSANALATSFTSDITETMGWNTQMPAAVVGANLVRLNDREITVTFPPCPNYLVTHSIDGKDTIHAVVPTSVIVEGTPTPTNATFAILDEPNPNLVTSMSPASPLIRGGTILSWVLSARGGFHANDTFTLIKRGQACNSASALDTNTTGVALSHETGAVVPMQTGNYSICHTPSRVVVANTVVQALIDPVVVADPVVVTPLTPPTPTVATEGHWRMFNLSLVRAPLATVSISITPTVPQITIVPATLNFSPSNWGQGQMVNITAIDDTLDEVPSQVLNVTMSLTSADVMFHALQQRFEFSALDNDMIYLNTSAISVTVTENDANATVAVNLVARQPGTAVTVAIASSNPFLKTWPTTLVFSGATYADPQDVLIYAPNDNITVDTWTAELSLTYVGVDTEYITDLNTPQYVKKIQVTINDNSASPNLVLQTLPPVVRNTGPRTIAGFASLSTLTNVPAYSSMELSATPVTMFTGAVNLTNTGTLSFTPHPTTTGACTVRVRLHFADGRISTWVTTTISVIDVPAPSLTAIAPATGNYLGGTKVTISGNHFGFSLAAITGVTIAGAACTNVQYISYGSLACTTGAVTSPAPGAVVTVTTTQGSSSDITFDYLDSPLVSSVSPKFVKVGTPSIVVTIKGAFFGADASDLVGVSLAGKACTTPTWVSSSEVTCTSAVATSTDPYLRGDVIVTTASAGSAVPSASGWPQFTFAAAPTLSLVVPSSGSFIKEHSVTITGNNFGFENDDTVRVDIASKPCNGVNRVSDTELTCTTPVFTAWERGQVVVETSYGGPSTPQGSSDTAPDVFQLLIPPPVITNFSPARVLIAEASNITITGLYLHQSRAKLLSVSIAGVPCTELDPVSSTTVVCSMKAAWSSQGIIGNVTLTTEKGTASGPVLFVGRTNPNMPATFELESGSIRSGLMTGGDTITINGELFGANKFNLVSATFTHGSANVSTRRVEWISPYSIKVVTPPFPKSGMALVAVETVSGSLGASIGKFLYMYPPPVGELGFPRIGDRLSTTRVTLTGTYFGEFNNVTISATVGGQPCTDAQYVSIREISCVVPPHSSIGSDNPQFAVTVDGQTSAPFRIGFKYVPASELCAPSCPLRAECQPRSATQPNPYCQCFPGWTGPKCDVSLVAIDKIKDTSTEDGGEAHISVMLLQPPTSAVIIRATSDTPSEAVAVNEAVTIPAKAENSPVAIRLKGIADNIRDGTQEYKVQLKMESEDMRYHNAVLDPITLLNTDSSPVLERIVPTICPRNGTWITIAGRNFDPFLRVAINGTVIPESAIQLLYGDIDTTMKYKNISNITAQVYSRTRLLQSSAAADYPSGFAFKMDRISDATPDGYQIVRAINAGGTAGAHDSLLYVSDDCPESGFYGRGADCAPCPPCGQCPGGYRIWPLPGCYGGIESGTVMPLKACDPPERCLGTQSNLCLAGYTGEYCSLCAEGYTMTKSGLCDPCPEPEGQYILIFCDIVVWLTLAMAGWFIEDRENLAHVIGLMLAFQTIAGVGSMVASNLAKWLREVYSVFHLFSGDIQFLKPDCQGRINHELEFGLRLAYNFFLAIPMIGGVAVVGCFAVWHNRRTYGDLEAKERKEHYIDRGVRMIFIWMTLMYLTVTTSSLDMLSCVNFGDGSYRTISSPDHICWQTPAHIATTVGAGFIILFYSIGYPLSMFLWQRRNRHKFAGIQEDLRFIDRWDFLQEPYKVAHQFGWFAEIFVSIVLAFGDTFLAPYPFEQFLVVGSAFVIVSVWIIIYRPYHRGWENLIMLAINLASLDGVVLIWLLREDMINVQVAKILAYTLGALIGSAALTFLCIVIYHIFIKSTVLNEVDRFGRHKTEIQEEYQKWFHEMDMFKSRIEDEHNAVISHVNDTLENNESFIQPTDRFVFLDIDSDEETTTGDSGAKGGTSGEPSEEAPVENEAADSAGLAASDIRISMDSTESNKGPTGAEAPQVFLPNISESRRGTRRKQPNKVLVARPAVLPPKPEAKLTDNAMDLLQSLAFWKPTPGAMPPYWNNRNENGLPCVVPCSLGDGEDGPIETVTEAICELMQKTFLSQLVGGGSDNPDLNHNAIEIVGVERIENPMLWSRYRTRAEELVAIYKQRALPPLEVATDGPGRGVFEGLTVPIHKDKGANEVYLFHGSNSAVVPVIADSGFDSRVSSRKNLFGEGVYFAEHSSKADEYSFPDPNGICTMVLVRVCMGLPFVTLEPHEGLRRPPCVKGHSGDFICSHPRFNSLVGEKGKGAYLKKYREFVIYEGGLAYPEYVISYKRVTKDITDVDQAAANTPDLSLLATDLQMITKE